MNRSFARSTGTCPILARRRSRLESIGCPRAAGKQRIVSQGILRERRERISKRLFRRRFLPVQPIVRTYHPGPLIECLYSIRDASLALGLRAIRAEETVLELDAWPSTAMRSELS
jgi:hypothetical protein